MAEILFVCTGNTCRSAMAACIYKALATNDNVKSAGIAARDGAYASDNAMAIMSEMGHNLFSHRAKRLTEKDIKDSHIILCMTVAQANVVREIAPAMVDKVYTLGKYSEGVDKDISDPFGGNIDIYRQCAAEIRRLLTKVAEIRKNS